MNEILICKDCKSTWGSDRKTTVNCPECNGGLLPMKIPTVEWRSFNQEKKDAIKEKFINDLKKNEENISPYYIMETYLRNIDQNIKTIKNILVFFTILWGILIVIAFLS